MRELSMTNRPQLSKLPEYQRPIFVKAEISQLLTTPVIVNGTIVDVRAVGLGNDMTLAVANNRV